LVRKEDPSAFSWRRFTDGRYRWSRRSFMNGSGIEERYDKGIVQLNKGGCIEDVVNGSFEFRPRTTTSDEGIEGFEVERRFRP
jgi:hypothetical protein